METVETHLLLTRGAELTISQETAYSVEQVKSLADVCYDIGEIGQCPASGSFPMDAMIVVPCSMKTVAGIVSGYSDNLLLRAADVTIKEARPLILVPRESPLSPIHLRNLQELSAMGVRIVPPLISFYQNYTTIEEWTNNFVERLLEVVGLKNEMKSCSGMKLEDKVKGQIMRMNSWQKEVTLLGKKVQIFICQTDCGVQLLIAGGDRSHIGSVSIADEQSNLVSHVFDGHRDNVIGDQWAKVLSQKWKVPVVVSVGIHYDSITPQEIQLVVETMTQLLHEIVQDTRFSPCEC